jgi:hypothetical protein
MGRNTRIKTKTKSDVTNCSLIHPQPVLSKVSVSSIMQCTQHGTADGLAADRVPAKEMHRMY